MNATADQTNSSLGRLGEFRVIASDSLQLFSHLSKRRRQQLYLVLALQLLGALSEVLSLGAVLPFLAALTNAKALLARPEIAWLSQYIPIDNEVELVFLMAVAFSLAIALVNLMRVATLWLQSRVAAAIGSDLIAEVYRRTLLQPYQFHTNVSSSSLISSVVFDFNVAMSTILSVMMLTLQALVIISIVSALLVLNPAVAIGMGVTGAIAYALISHFTKTRLVQYGKVISDQYMDMLRTLQEGYGGIRDVVLGGQQPLFVARFSNADRPIRRGTADSQFIRATPRYILETVLVLLLSMAAALLTLFSGEGGSALSTLPLLGAVALAANRLLPAMQQVYLSLSSMQGSHVSLQRTLTALNRQPDPVALIVPDRPAVLRRSLCLRHVWFSYLPFPQDGADADWILRDISLDVPVSGTVALVGSTGSGKSTVADILLGLLRPQKGVMELDGVPMDDALLAAWRSSIAHVPQSVYLSDSTFAENIAFGSRPDQIDMELVREAARAARIADFIESRPLQYNQTVGERGIRLSGGQRQRIGIARALYKNAQMIVFDEATSALDNATERAVMEAIGDLSRRKTIVLIAHRITTVRDADVIFEINKGRIVASGTYDELMRTSASFRTLTMADAE